MITTHQLTKRFGKVVAVDGIDLDVREGDIYGFLGANGSGKTTTVRMLLGLVLPTSGEAHVLGESMPKAGPSVLPRVGALVENPAAYRHLSGRSNLWLLESISHQDNRRARRRRIDDVLEQVGLGSVGSRPVRAYSLGMRQRLGLAAALVRKPRILVLDEPTNGLDPQGIQEIRSLLLNLHAEGTTIFLSSHLLAEVDQMCTRVGVLDRGRLVLQDELANLHQPTGRVVVRTPDAALAVTLLGGRVEERLNDRFIVRATEPSALNAELVGAGIRVDEISAERPTLEQIVLAATEQAA
ncbi:ABC transporter ATP-binding protein [soil metagenome]